MNAEPPHPTRAVLRAHLERGIHAVLRASNRIRLPGPTVLPIAGAVVGLYSGLAAGIFANLIGVVRGVAFNVSWLLSLRPSDERPALSLWDRLAAASWHPEYAIIGAPLVAGGLVLARIIEPGGPRDEVKRRLRLLALLMAGALALYYPLVALTAINRYFGNTHSTVEVLKHLPWWVFLLSPTIGGALVGRLLRDYPATHGHGLPEVVRAVKGNQALPGQYGLLKLVASALTLGSGGSAGREGPIVYGGAAFASTVGRTLGFSRRELAILLACGAGAGISASFNAPIAGAVFAMEIILREFELRVFSPIILACVAGTLVGRGIIGVETSMISRLDYRMVSGWEVICYALLGIMCGLLAYTFVRMMHRSEDYFAGRMEGGLSAWLGRRPLPVRAAIGGLCAGLMGMVSPTTWGSGHDFINLAALGQLSFLFLVTACVIKLLATSITLGSGGSGGTFFPSALLGTMAGGAFGTLVHYFFPASTGPSGAYALVGMGGTMAGLTRGPLTGMMMLYELSLNHALILPLMVTCTIASAVCHYLIERKTPKTQTDEELLSTTPVSALMSELAPVPANMHLRPLMDQVLTTESGTLPVLDGNGQLYGIVHMDQFREIWREEGVFPVLVAGDLARKVPLLSPETDLAHALVLMDQEDVDALPVRGPPGSQTCGLLTRARVRRFLSSHHTHQHARGEHAVAPTELSH